MMSRWSKWSRRIIMPYNEAKDCIARLAEEQLRKSLKRNLQVLSVRLKIDLQILPIFFDEARCVLRRRPCNIPTQWEVTRCPNAP